MYGSAILLATRNVDVTYLTPMCFDPAKNLERYRLIAKPWLGFCLEETEVLPTNFRIFPQNTMVDDLEVRLRRVSSWCANCLRPTGTHEECLQFARKWYGEGI